MRISDWSSDVCSSDLRNAGRGKRIDYAEQRLRAGGLDLIERGGECTLIECSCRIGKCGGVTLQQQKCVSAIVLQGRSEERRVGKEWFSTCRSRGEPFH